MKPTFIVLLVLCAFVVAMVPRDRRALNTEDEQWFQPDSNKPTGKPREICARTTPCGWSVYKPESKTIDFNITNTYCDCAKNMVCQITEDDSTVNVFVHHCLLTTEESKIIES